MADDIGDPFANNPSQYRPLFFFQAAEIIGGRQPADDPGCGQNGVGAFQFGHQVHAVIAANHLANLFLRRASQLLYVGHLLKRAPPAANQQEGPSIRDLVASKVTTGTRSSKRKRVNGSVTPGLALDLVRDSHTVLSFLGALSSRGRDTRPTAEDKLPARAAPQTWPRSARPVPVVRP